MATDQPPAPVQSSTDLLVDVFGGPAEPTPAPVEQPIQATGNFGQPAPPVSNNLLDGNQGFFQVDFYLIVQEIYLVLLQPQHLKMVLVVSLKWLLLKKYRTTCPNFLQKIKDFSMSLK